MRIQINVILLLFYTAFSIGQTTKSNNVPKLILIINIDQLQTEQLQTFRNKFTSKGFNILSSEGLFFHDASYETSSNYTGTRQLNFYTGAYPCSHGIISDKWYSTHENNPLNAYHFISNNTSHPDSGHIVTQNVEASTFADEIAISNQKSKIATISIRPEDHAFFAHSNKITNYWFDRSTGNIIANDTTKLPDWVNSFNNIGFANLYATKQWGPISDIKTYHEYSYTNENNSNIRHFLYNLNDSKNQITPFEKISGSPYINILIRDFAASLIIHEEYGKDKYPDLLSVNFTCNPFNNNQFHIYDAEVEDMLIRLDEQIESLIGVIKENVGIEHSLIILTSTATSFYDQNTLEENFISSGTFNGTKTSALLNLYLMAIYGQGKWVKGYHDKQFYLNHDLINSKKISLSEIQEKTAEFLLEVSGIKQTIPADNLRNYEYSSGYLNAIQKSYFYGRSGDIFISLKPGWSEATEDDKIKADRFSIPLIFYGWNINGSHIFNTVKMVNVAPTISTLLNIPRPNASENNTINELIKFK